MGLWAPVLHDVVHYTHNLPCHHNLVISWVFSL